MRVEFFILTRAIGPHRPHFPVECIKLIGLFDRYSIARRGPQRSAAVNRVSVLWGITAPGGLVVRHYQAQSMQISTWPLPVGVPPVGATNVTST